MDTAGQELPQVRSVLLSALTSPSVQPEPNPQQGFHFLLEVLQD